MKNTYVAPETEIVILSENDVLAFSNRDVNGGKLPLFTWDDLTDVH